MRRAKSTLGHILQSTALRYHCTHGRLATGTTLPTCWTVPAETNHQEPADDLQDKLARLEAVLFLSHEPISTRKLANLANLADGTEARTLLRELGRRYQRRSGAMQVVDVAGGVQLLTKPQLAPWIRRLHGDLEEMTLSAPALETLSVVAYRQPVVRAEVEAIRSVQCGEILRVLMERDLLRIVGRADELGRPFLYGTTKKFLQVFGLRRLEQLPGIDQIRSVEGIV